LRNRGYCSKKPDGFL